MSKPRSNEWHVPAQVAQVLAEALTWTTHELTLDEFRSELEEWYNEFKFGECTLGYAAAQLGLNKVDLIHMLDWLGWPASNV